jgi:protein-tyrosine phosphatase
MAKTYSRQIDFENVPNFRDIGGYRTRGGDTVAWRRLFRSGELRHMTGRDLNKLREEIRLTSVIDLRSTMEIERQGIGLLSEIDIKYHSIPILPGANRAEDEKLFRQCTNMGEFYLHFAWKKEFGDRMIQALEVITRPENHPAVFHCAVGKDRTGILAAVLLSVLGVEDKDIIEDYSLSGPYMEELLKKINSDPKMSQAAQPLPEYFWKASPESMELFLSTLRQEYGSISDYLTAQGAGPSLIGRLKTALLS